MDYLNTIKDGVGERLINIDHSVLNNPGFRSFGWQPHANDIRRTHSPPIPTAVTSEYYRKPRSTSKPGAHSFVEEEEEDNGLTTVRGGNETAGPTTLQRRKRMEQLTREDSSDLSEESDEESDAR
jgi:target of rapamycin complex 2 subunit MAPKAP1